MSLRVLEAAQRNRDEAISSTIVGYAHYEEITASRYKMCRIGRLSKALGKGMVRIFGPEWAQ